MAQVAALGRLVLSPFTSMASWYNATALAHPVTTGVVTTGLKTSAADLFAQKVVERREEMDWARHAVFCTFGFAYLGGFQYYLYNVKFSQVGPPRRDGGARRGRRALWGAGLWGPRALGPGGVGPGASGASRQRHK